jgi:trigger factor
MSVDSSRLTIDVHEGEGWRRTVSVTVPAAEVQKERTRLARSFASRARLPGFRPGKVPTSVIEKHYGATLDQQMVDQVVNDAYRGALESHDLKPISDGELEDLQYEKEEDLTFRISFDVEPVVELERLGGFSVNRPAVQVGDDEVNRVLERLRDQNGHFEPVEEGRPEAGDMVALTVTRLEDHEVQGEPQDYDLVLGEGDAIPDVESAIYTLEVGEEGEFDVTFPDDFPNEERRGETEHLRIRLRERKVKRLPDLDDDFARSVGDFDSLDVLRERIRGDLEREAENEAEGAVRGQLLTAILEANPFPVPVSMVERYMDSVLGDTAEAPPERLEEIKGQLRPEAERAVKRFLVVDRVAEMHDLAATEDEVDERVQEIAERNRSNPAEVYARLQKSGRLEQLEREVTEAKVFDLLKEQSTVTDE